ncbi:hypothetical protein ECE50_010110 [Chitinophaga sp. Mgbs1]|uniref:Uncharacterized protein n=1 Tax=Chitinophaga solisilvae TaxID=1233460 RepID=A0A9Q5GLA9_9BACT|nr:hypothetical protein [Chitinophaga solisilvae]
MILERYECSQINENAFVFATELGNQYCIKFEEHWVGSSGYLPGIGERINICEMTFERWNIVSNAHDPKIAATIVFKGLEYLRRNQVVFYTADNPSKRDKELFRLYHIWFWALKRVAAGAEGAKAAFADKKDKVVVYDDKEIFFSCFYMTDYWEPELDYWFFEVLKELYPGSTIRKY